MSSQALEFVLRRDRAVILAALIVITGLAWAYVLSLANDMAMGGMDMTGFRMIPAGMGLMMPASAPWQPIEFIFMFMMWVVMMIGMMTPSAAPMVLLYARVGRQAAMQGKPFANSYWFFGGYLLAWVAFALVATPSAMGSSTRLTVNADDGKCERDIRQRPADRGRALPVVAEGCMPAAMPSALAIHPASRRIPPRRERLA